jgi:hypothetical protein
MKLNIENIDKLKGVKLKPMLAYIEECIDDREGIGDDEYRFKITDGNWFSTLVILERKSKFVSRGMSYYTLYDTNSTHKESISKEDIENIEKFKTFLFQIIRVDDFHPMVYN